MKIPKFFKNFGTILSSSNAKNGSSSPNVFSKVPENFRNRCWHIFESYIFTNMIGILLDCNWNAVLGCGGSKDSWPDGQQAHREESGEEDWESQGKNNQYFVSDSFYITFVVDIE
jgi:hypothetical protein